MADEMDDLLLEGIERPAKRFSPAPPSRHKPLPKAPLVRQVSSKIAGARTDAELEGFLADNLTETVVINFGSSFCHSCHAMFPHFHRLATEYPKNKYILAQIDYMTKAAQGIRYTPMFNIVRKGQLIDQFYDASSQRLQDHLWLHSDD